jgi:hypothetical protein
MDYNKIRMQIDVKIVNLPVYTNEDAEWKAILYN